MTIETKQKRENKSTKLDSKKQKVYYVYPMLKKNKFAIKKQGAKRASKTNILTKEEAVDYIKEKGDYKEILIFNEVNTILERIN